MRILYCNKYNFPFSGTEVYLFDLMQMMEAHGHQVALFSMADERGATTPYDGYFVRHVDFKNSKHSFLERVRLAAHAVYSREARCRLGQMIEEFRPDVAHVRNIYHHLSPSIFWELKQRGIPVLYHLNDFKLLCPNYNLVARGRVCERCQGGRFWNVVAKDCYGGGSAAGAVLALEAYVHRCLRTYGKCVTRLLAPSEFVRAKLVENGWAADRIDVLPHYQKLPAQSAGRRARFWNGVSVPNTMFCFSAGSLQRKIAISSSRPTMVSTHKKTSCWLAGAIRRTRTIRTSCGTQVIECACSTMFPEMRSMNC